MINIFGQEEFRMLVQSVLPEAMKMIWRYQVRLYGFGSAEVKAGDESLVTQVDREVESFVLAEIARRFPGVRVVAEEGGALVGDGEVYLYVDPVDGTREFTNGTSLSNTIIAVMRGDEVVGCVVAEPISGRTWSAWKGDGCYYQFFDYARDCFMREERLSVCPDPFSTQGTVYIDSSQGFTRADDGRKMFSNRQNAELFRLLNDKIHVRVLGPNGTIHALVANGAQGAVGAVTLARGYPWDASPVLLVLEAGGSARAFYIGESGLEERSPTLVNQIDLLVTGNSPSTVDAITENLILAYEFGR